MDHWLTRLERKFGRLGIPHLITYVLAGRALAYFLAMTDDEFTKQLILDPQAVRHGEIWRVITYVFTPPTGGIVFAAIELYFTYMIASALEETWGTFRFTLYYFIGALATAATAFFMTGVPITPTYLNLSLFLAFATLFPDFTVLLFFILPIKVKYLGWITAGYITIAFWFDASLTGKLSIVVALGNYLIFFWSEIREWIRAKFQRTGSDLRAALKGDSSSGPAGARTITVKPIHRCITCGRTEHDDREMEFRVCACARCGEGREFCMEHLQEHRREES